MVEDKKKGMPHSAVAVASDAVANGYRVACFIMVLQESLSRRIQFLRLIAKVSEAPRLL